MAAAAARIFIALVDLGTQIMEEDYDAIDWWPWQSAGPASAVIERIHQVNQDWSFLSTLCEFIRCWSDAGESLLSIALKIEAAAEQIAEDLEEKRRHMKKQYWEWEFLELVDYCRTQTKSLMVDIREAMNDLSVSSFQVHSPPLLHDDDDDSFSSWISFVDSVLWNVKFILSTTDSAGSLIIRKEVYALYKELKMIRDYIYGVHSSGFQIDFPETGYDDDDNDNDNDDDDDDDDDVTIIDDFLNHVASVIVRSAIQSCNYWFHYITATETDPRLKEVVEDLHYEIDTTNPKFIEFHLHFLIAISKIGRHQGGDLVDYFCTYLVQWRHGGIFIVNLFSQQYITRGGGGSRKFLSRN